MRLTVVREPGRLEMSVWNEGPGFSPEDRGKLFRRFSRLHQPEFRGVRGTGVGLYNAWRIVKLHGGRIRARSEPGSWAEFAFELSQPLPLDAGSVVAEGAGSVAGDAVSAPGHARRGLLARLGERSIIEKILIANSVIILIGAVFGTYFTRRYAGQSGIALTAIFFLCGVGITVLANYLVLRAALRPLVELSRAMESLHKGEPQEVHIDSSDPNLRRVSRSFNEMCRRLEDESKTYSAKLLSSIEEERRRIGRELHDDTSQTLAAVMINLDLVDKALANASPAIRERVENSKELLRYTLGQIKLLVYDLRPVMLDDFGLVPTLRWYIQSYSEGSGPSIELDVEAVTLRLPGDVETALFRITQEAIANAVKHSGGDQGRREARDRTRLREPCRHRQRRRVRPARGGPAQSAGARAPLDQGARGIARRHA